MFDYSLFKQILSISEKKRQISDSFIKHEVAERLLDKLSFIKVEPKIIYLEGAFSKLQIEYLSQAFPNTIITFQLEQKVDLILSNCCLHTSENVSQVLHRWQSYLAKDGFVMFAILGGDSLIEIKRAWQLIDSFVHTNQMIDMQDLGDVLLKQVGLQNPVMDSETLKLKYENIDKIWQDIRALQEPLADNKMRRTITGKKRWQLFIKELLEQGLEITVEIIYGYAQKLDQTIAVSDVDQKATLSLDGLKSELKKHRK